MISTRPEIEAAEQEYESFLLQGGLERDQLQHIRLEEVDFLDAFTAGDVSGVFIDGSPILFYNCICNSHVYRITCKIYD